MAASDKTKTTEPTEENKVDDLLEAVATPAFREQRIAAPAGSVYDPWQKTYTQKKLGFLAKMEFTRLIGKAMKNALKGDDGIDLGEIMAMAGQDGDRSADTFIYAIAQLAEFAPGLIKDIIVVALGVPTHERPIVEQILDEPYDEDTQTGGLSDEDGLAILATFIGQNGRVMRDFFLEEIPKLGKLAQAAMAPDSTPASSKRSRRSARTTQ